MTLKAIASACGLAAAVCLVGDAEARNPHCAGGIQYVVLAVKDKDRGNLEDYERQIRKAVEQLEKCAAESPKDFEAIGYLGWAYAEVDSAGPAGKVFATAIKGLLDKEDRKKAEWVTNNRNSFWARSFNEGIGKIQAAEQAYPDFCKPPENEADETLRGEAEQRYQEAQVSLTRALLLRPGDPQTVRNLASVHAFRCEFPEAAAILREGLKQAPGDTLLREALRTVRINHAKRLADEKKYDEALVVYGELAKADSSNADHHLSIADVYFRRAQGQQGDARKADFRLAGEGFAKAARLRPDAADLAFNAALAYRNAESWELSAANWTRALKLRPDDVDALSGHGEALVELKRCNEAIQATHRAVSLRPKDRLLHRQLGSIYTRCGNNARGTDELMVYLAMQSGKPAADPAALAKAARQGTDAARTLASEGVPEEIYEWEADNQRFETWFYWTKKSAYLFGSSGALSRKSDWATAEASPTAAGKP